MDNNDIEVKSFEEKVVEIDNDDIDIFAELEYIDETSEDSGDTIILDPISLLENKEEDFPIYFDNDVKNSSDDDETIVFNPDDFIETENKEEIRNNMFDHIQEKFSKISFISDEIEEDSKSDNNEIEVKVDDNILQSENEFKDKLEIQDMKAEKLLEELELLKDELADLEEPREIPVEDSETIARLAKEINK